MIEWSETHLAIRDTFRRFVEAEIKPNLTELEHGDTPPYTILRKMSETFGLGDVPFTPDEVLALVFGEDLLRPLEGTVFHDSIRSAIQKIRAALGPEVDSKRKRSRCDGPRPRPPGPRSPPVRGTSPATGPPARGRGGPAPTR